MNQFPNSYTEFVKIPVVEGSEESFIITIQVKEPLDRVEKETRIYVFILISPKHNIEQNPYI